MIGFIVVILIGALCGWLASMIMRTDAQQGAFANILIGIVGSLLAKVLFSDVLKIGGATAGGSFNIMDILWGVLGSVVLIAILKALRVLR